MRRACSFLIIPTINNHQINNNNSSGKYIRVSCLNTDEKVSEITSLRDSLQNVHCTNIKTNYVNDEQGTVLIAVYNENHKRFFWSGHVTHFT